ncbi:hypothetical protein LXL04_039832 [Taraxacum kok-saghyz]
MLFDYKGRRCSYHPMFGTEHISIPGTQFPLPTEGVDETRKTSTERDLSDFFSLRDPDIVSFVELCQKLDLLVMLWVGPYICAEWDFGGFPAWLLTKEPSIRLRSSDPVYLTLVDKWWGTLFPKISHLLYHKGGPIVMLQIENEFGSYGVDKNYMHHLVNLARSHLGDDLILYTTDGGNRDTLTKGTINGDAVFSASALENILSRNGSAVLYMAHGGTNFGFYNGANAQESESNYLADLTSYDYDAPISESGDVDGAKFKALRSVITEM